MNWKKVAVVATVVSAIAAGIAAIWWFTRPTYSAGGSIGGSGSDADDDSDDFVELDDDFNIIKKTNPEDEFE
jgi:hypothetical protein